MYCQNECLIDSSFSMRVVIKNIVILHVCVFVHVMCKLL